VHAAALGLAMQAGGETVVEGVSPGAAGRRSRWPAGLSATVSASVTGAV